MRARVCASALFFRFVFALLLHLCVLCLLDAVFVCYVCIVCVFLLLYLFLLGKLGDSSKQTTNKTQIQQPKKRPQGRALFLFLFVSLLFMFCVFLLCFWLLASLMCSVSIVIHFRFLIFLPYPRSLRGSSHNPRHEPLTTPPEFKDSGI